MGGIFRTSVVAIWLAVALLALAAPAGAQVPFPSTSSETAPPQVPENLTPEAVDGLLARLSDEDIRTLLRDELVRRAEAQASVEAEPTEFEQLRDRFSTLTTTVSRNVIRFAEAFGTLHEREARARELIATASNGLSGIIFAFISIAAAALAAAAVVRVLTTHWRSWLRNTSGDSYWDRLVRTAALTVVELLPVAAFSWTMGALAPFFAAELGPMLRDGLSYIWIFEAGVTNVWIAFVLSRRVFAPDAPQLRIANVSDKGAQDIHRLNLIVASIGMLGWLIAGLFPTFGFGFRPAAAIVALSGTAAFLYFAVDLARNWADVRYTTASLLGADHTDETPTASAQMLTAGAPWAIVVYATLAYLYWLALWLETGQQHLLGPVGTLLVLLTLPAFDRLGDELVRALLRRRSTEVAMRFRSVLLGGWRVLLGLIAAEVIALLWGGTLLALVKGEGAPAWASAIFDIAVAILIGQLIWRLIHAALHREKRVAGGDMEEVHEESAGPTRLETLIPLLRNLLLMILTIIVLMIVLASLGVNIGPLLASAGIIGIAIGFGAQTLVRDIFSGAFFLIDDAFRVGEYIELEGDLRGEVEAISIRSLQLRHHRGAIVTIPFGELKNITNHSRDWVIYKMAFRLEPQTDPAQVKKIVKRIGFELLEDPEHGPKFIEPLKSQGVFQIDDDSALIIRVKFKSKPRMQFVLRREVYHRLRTAFAENDIHFARRKVEVVGADPAGGAAAALATEPQQPSPLGASSAAQ